MKKRIINLACIFLGIGLTCLPSFAASPGSLDPSFGVAGKVVTNVLGEESIADIAVHSDGRIVASLFSSGTQDFTLVRYLANGSLDTSFGGDGIVLTDFGNSGEVARSVVVQPDGKTVACGGQSAFSTDIARYTTTGQLDTSFDSDGRQRIGNVGCRELALQSDGKIIGVGSSQNVDFTVFRYNPNGTLDTSFGTNGIVSTNFPGRVDFSDVKILANGKIVCLGSSIIQSPFSETPVIVTYNSNGSLDTTFSGDGILPVTTPNISLKSISVDPISNSITAVGGVNGGGGIAIRYTPSGNLDTNFDGDGILTFSFGTLTRFTNVLIQSDRKILIIGTSRFPNTTSSRRVALLRLNNNGTLDQTFGTNGARTTQVSENEFFNIPDNPTEFYGDKVIIGGTTVSNNIQLTRINLSIAPTATADFDGDGIPDTAVYRPSTGNWFILQSSTNTVAIDTFGANGDIPIDGDFDGDGKSDLAVYRPSVGEWYFKRSSDATIFGAPFGSAGDKPIAGDYDRDGKTDIAIFRPGNGNWIILRSSTGFGTFFAYPFGQVGDIPLTQSGL
jgi:uncharacterized delta-60 repeat protein